MSRLVFISVTIIDYDSQLYNFARLMKTDEGCESSADYSCLQEKSPKEIVDCAWGGPMLTEDGPSNICKSISR